METSELYARGLRRRKKLFGEADVAERMAAAGEFGAPLQNIINGYVYGDVWERSGLTDEMRSLVMLGMMALFAVLPGISPKPFDVRPFRNTYLFVMDLVVGLMGYLHALTLIASLSGKQLFLQAFL